MSDIHDFSNDPRLTAYALGELEGEARAGVEALLARDESARRFVDEIRATATLVAAGLGRDGGAALTAEQRAAITAKAASAKSVFRMRPVHWMAAAASVAAAATIVASAPWRSDEAPKTVAAAAVRDREATDVSALNAQVTSAVKRAEPSRPDTRTETHEGDGISIEKGQTRGGAEQKYPAPPTVPPPDAERKPGVDSFGVRAESGADAATKASHPAEVDVPDGPVADPGVAVTSNGSTPLAGTAGGPGGDKGGVPNPRPSTVYSYSGGGGGGGAKVGGAAPPAPPPRPAKPAGGDAKKKAAGAFAGPSGETPPQTREPSDPPPSPEGGGPSTPGGGGGAGGPTTGGPDAGSYRGGIGGAAPGRADFDELTEEEKRLQDGVVASKEGPDARDRLKLRRVRADDAEGSESYAHVDDNPFRIVKDAPLSTFGVDVDTAAYSNVRRFLNSNRLPPPGAVRIEEMVNYFPYDYAPPTDGRPFAVRVDVAGCPWQTDHRLVRVGIKGKVVEAAARPTANLVFLIDVSGSMNEPAKLPLLVQSMKLMTEKLERHDRVAIVVYAGNSGLVLPSTECSEKEVVLAALGRLQAGGSTNGGAGIQLAYETAMANRIEGGINRVILATDGDFNVGVTDESSLVKLIEEKAKSGVYLSVLGFGTGNLKDAQMEKLADRGNGNYAYVDTLKEGQKALVEQMSGTLCTIAKDVKLQLEFNPAQVGAYRLIGYENRVLAAEDFKDDKKDAGEIGAGHTVTALYEIIPPGVLTQTAGVDPLKYQQPPAPTGDVSRELMTVKLRWKEPNSDVSTPMEVPVVDDGRSYSSASPDFKFAASVAAFGMLLRNSPYKGQANFDAILELAGEGTANDPGGYRAEFVGMVKRAKGLAVK